MDAPEAFFTVTMIAAAAVACLAFAFLLGRDDWELFAAICLVYFVFTFIGYLKAYGDEHYANVR